MIDPTLFRARLRSALVRLIREKRNVDGFVANHLPHLAQQFAAEPTMSLRVELLLNAASPESLTALLLRSFPELQENLADASTPTLNLAGDSAPLLACIYSPIDKPLFSALAAHLAPVTMMARASLWSIDTILPGAPEIEDLLAKLGTADLILMLLSADFFVMPNVRRILRLALRRHKERANVVVPILIRSVLLKTTPLQALALLPSNGVPVSSWSNPDEAWLDVVKGIRRLIHFPTGNLSESVPLSTAIQFQDSEAKTVRDADVSVAASPSPQLKTAAE